MKRKGDEATVTIRCLKQTHHKLRLLAAHWYVNLQEALERAVSEALERTEKEQPK